MIDSEKLESSLERLHEMADRLRLCSMRSVPCDEISQMAMLLQKEVEGLSEIAQVRLDALEMPKWVVYDVYSSGEAAYVELFSDEAQAQQWLEHKLQEDDDGYCGCEVYAYFEAEAASNTPPSFDLLSAWRIRNRAEKAENAIIGAFV